MQYSTGKHCIFYHRFHIVWSTKYRYKVLTGALRCPRWPTVFSIRGLNGCFAKIAPNSLPLRRRAAIRPHHHKPTYIPPPSLRQQSSLNCFIPAEVIGVAVADHRAEHEFGFGGELRVGL